MKCTTPGREPAIYTFEKKRAPTLQGWTPTPAAAKGVARALVEISPHDTKEVHEIMKTIAKGGAQGDARGGNRATRERGGESTRRDVRPLSGAGRSLRRDGKEESRGARHGGDFAANAKHAISDLFRVWPYGGEERCECASADRKWSG